MDQATTAVELVDLAEVRDGRAIVTYSRTEAAIAVLREKYKDAKYDLTTTAGDKAARAGRLELKTLRTDLEDKRKELKAPALEFGKKIDAEAARLTVEIQQLEAPIDAQIKADEKRRDDERRAKEEAEAARKKVHTDAIARLGGYVAQAADLNAERLANGIGMLEGFDLSGFEEYTGEATETRDRTLAALRALHVKALAREAEEARLVAERAEQARIAQQQAEQARQLKAQQDEIDRQRAALEEAQAKALAEQEAREAEQRRQDAAAEEARRMQQQQTGAETQSTPVTPAPSVTQVMAGVAASTAGDAEFYWLNPGSAQTVVPMPTRAPAAAPANRDWQAAETMPQEPTDWIEVQTVSTYRFQPYKPNSQEARRGIRGRWQCGNEYGGWENCEQPEGPWRHGAIPAGRAA